MIVTHTVNQPTIKLPNGALSGVSLIPESERKGYSMYEARIGAGQTVPLRSPDDQACVHFYYFITGSGKCQKNDSGGNYDIGPDQFVALSSDLSHTLTVSAEGEMRVVVVYYPDSNAKYKSLEMVKKLCDVIGTKRDVSFGNGNSRRFTIKQDGFPLSISNTLVYSSTSSKQEYKNHMEAAYFFSGRNTYRFKDDAANWTTEPTKIDGKNGTNFFMNLHDKHILTVYEVDCTAICVFDPPLSGEERHQFTEDGFSSY